MSDETSTNQQKMTTILVSRETRRRLGQIGSLDETLDQVVARLIDAWEKQER